MRIARSHRVTRPCRSEGVGAAARAPLSGCTRPAASLAVPPLTPPRCSLAGVPAGELWRVGSRAVAPTRRSATWPPVARHGARCCHWRQPCICTAPRLASAASAVALSSARRWLAGAAPALRDRPDASSGVPEPWSLARGVRDGRFACHTGAAVRGSEAGASADASQQARAGVACTSRRALYPYVRRPSRPPFPWRAVPVRAPEPYPDRTQAGAARGSEAGASADGSQQARAGGACTSRRALYPHVRRRSRPPLPWLALPERPALSQTATVRFLPPQARVVLVSRRGARVARCGIA